VKIALNTIALDRARWDADKSKARDLEEILPAIAQAGYPTVEIWQYHITNRDPDALPEFKEAAGNLGLEFSVVGAYPLLHEEGDQRLEQMLLMKGLMGACATLGARVLKIFAGRIASGKIEPEERQRSISFLRELLDGAAQRGLTVTIETHGNTLADSPEAAEALRGELSAPNLKYCFQPFKLTEPDRVMDDYERLREHIAHVHLQGNDGSGFALLRDSVIDYAALLRRLKEDGFDGVLGVEFVKDCHPKDPDEYDDDKVISSAADDLAFIREVWGDA